MANVILNKAIVPLSTADHTTLSQMDTRKRNVSTTEGNDSDAKTKRRRQANGKTTVENTTERKGREVFVLQCTKPKAVRG